MKKPDWEAIRKEYETDGVTARKLAEKYGISHTAINNRAKKEEWKHAEKKLSTSKVSSAKVSTKKVSTSEVETRKVERPKKVENRDERASIKKEKKSREEKKDLGFEPELFGLSEKQADFVYWFVKTKSRVEAYRQSGYTGEGNTAYVNASRMLRNAKVAKAVRALEKSIRERYTADLDEIVDQLVSITRADPNAISQYRRVNCRYCWGEDHLYQYRDDDEYDRAQKKAAKDGKIPPEFGGVGFISNMDANPDCPRCSGEGIGEIVMGDTRDLSGDEHVYYLGIKQTKNGIEAITESKQIARAQLLKILDIKNRASGKGEEIPEEDETDISEEQLNDALRSLGYGRFSDQLSDRETQSEGDE